MKSVRLYYEEELGERFQGPLLADNWSLLILVEISAMQ